MTEQELQQQRTDLWRLDPERPLRTLEDAREFFDAVGFALLYPSRSVLAPSLMGAYLSSEEDARDRKKAAADPRSADALVLANRLVREQVVYEVATERGRLLVSAAEFPYFYALLGDRNPKQQFNEGVHGEKRLQGDTLAIIESKGPSNKQELLAALSKGISEPALDRTLSELAQKLRVVRVPQLDEPDRFELMYRFAPELVNSGKQISNPEALSALVARYLETVVAADQKQVEDFVGLVSPRSRVSEVIKALTGAGEFAYTLVGEKNLLRVSSSIKPEPKVPYVPKPKFAREPRADSDERPKRFDRGEAPKRGFGERAPRADRPDRSGGDRPFKPRREFTPRDGDQGRGFRDRPPYQRRDEGERRSFRPGTKFGEQAGADGASSERPQRSFSSDRPKRPFNKERAGGDRPFTRDRGDRPPRKSFGDRGDRPARPFRPREEGQGDRPPRKSFGDRGDRPPRKSFGDRGDRPARPFRPREEGQGDRPPRKSFGDRGDRPARKSFGDRGDRPARPFRPREEGQGDRPPRKSFGDRGERPPRKTFGDRGDGPPRDRERSGAGGAERPFKPRGAKPTSGGAFKKFARPGGKSKFGKPAASRPPRGEKPPRKKRDDDGASDA